MKYLIVGLGNIGREYEQTRHNIGFDVVDELVENHEGEWELDKLALRAQFKHKGRNIIVIKPSTYMNLSGKSLKYWMTIEKVKLENVLIVVDDLALDFGVIRLRGKGSDAGHNGLKDIQKELNTSSYGRLRFGIGNNFGRGQQIQFVLGKWDNKEMEALPERIMQATKAIESFYSIGLPRTMSAFNNK